MSRSVTHTLPKSDGAARFVRRQRVYDHLYDPLYTVSSEADHTRAHLKAYMSQARVIVPEFESMFSNLAHHPRFRVLLDPTDPVPASLDRRWRGHAEKHREALQQLAGVIPNTQSWLKSEKCHVTGADRWKYFKRPLIPFEQELPLDVIFAPQRKDFVSTDENAEQPTHVTVGVQTDYRESETQTDPYSPEYVIKAGTNPSELLQLATLTWGHGLPAGLAEVEMIQRARAKRAWQATLPPLDDLSQMDKRRRMMEEMEAKEWAFRESEIQKLHEARLEVLKDLLMQRTEAQTRATNERLNQIYYRQQRDKETRLRKMDSVFARSLRKLETKRRNMKLELMHLGSGGDYTQYKARIKTFSNRKIHSEELKRHHLDTYEGLQKLEKGISASILKSQKSLMKDALKPPQSRTVSEVIPWKKSAQVTGQSLRFLVKKKKPTPRPVTPTVEEPAEEDEEIELAALHLQELLRGRSTQYKVFKGKENHMDLIQEIRTVHALQREEQELQKAEKDLIMSLKEQRDQQTHETSHEEASQARVFGAELQHLFYTLSKELIHLQEERRIHAFTLLAERDRRLREAEESGRRQAEDIRRREEDEIFRQVVQLHQETVDMYLEDIVLGTVEQISDQQAREEIRRKAKEVNDIVYAMEESRDKLQSEEIVSELVYSFVIPEAQKISVKQRVRHRQRRHLQAAQSIIQGAAEHSGIVPITLGASQSPCPSERAASWVLEEAIRAAEQRQAKETEEP